MASLPALIAYGLFIGISLGLTGGGGSIITVPLLVYLVGQPVHAAIPTSLVVVGATALSGYARRVSHANTFDGVMVGLAGVFGAVPGRLLAALFSGRMLLLLFALIMLLAAIFMFRSKTYEARTGGRPHWALVVAVGVGIGFLTGFLGVGGGFLIVPGLVLLLGMPMATAIPTSLLVIAINCASSLIGPLVLGRGAAATGAIDWRVAVLLVAGGIVGAFAGRAVAGRLNQRALKHVFAVFVFVVGAFVAASATGLIPLRVQ
jgi:uncharacterized membrane protein YfcA